MNSRRNNFSDPVPQEPQYSKEQIASAKNLHDIMCRPLESREATDNLRRTYDLFISPSPDCAFFLPNGIKDQLEEAVDATVRKGAQWRMFFQYDPLQDRIAIDSVGIPVVSERVADSGETASIILKRLGRFGFLVFDEKNGVISQRLNDDEESQTLLTGSSTTTQFDEDFVQTILDEVNVATRYDGSCDSSETVAQTLTDIPKWSGTDQLLTPVELDRQITLTRINSLDTVSGEENQYDTIHRAVMETVLEDGSRQQLIVEFKAEEFTVLVPEIYVQEIPQSDGIEDVQFYGNKPQHVRNRLEIEPTVAMMDILAEQLHEELADAA